MGSKDGVDAQQAAIGAMKLPLVVSCRDRVGAFGWGLTALVVFAPYYALFRLPWVVLPLSVGLTLWGAGVLSRRHVLVVDFEGIRLRSCWWWWIPVSTTSFRLDAEADVYWPLESDEPEGVCVRPRDVREMESECFGPAGHDAAYALCERVNRAITEARERVSPGSSRPSV